jgi:hypothetical protein
MAPNAAKMMNLKNLRDEGHGLQFDVEQEVIQELREGMLHDGVGATAQLIGTKAKVEGV